MVDVRDDMSYLQKKITKKSKEEIKQQAMKSKLKDGDKLMQPILSKMICRDDLKCNTSILFCR